MPQRRSGDGNLPHIPSRWQALALRNGRKVRITPDKRISVLDVIEAVTGTRNPSVNWSRIKK